MTGLYVTILLSNYLEHTAADRIPYYCLPLSGNENHPQFLYYQILKRVFITGCGSHEFGERSEYHVQEYCKQQCQQSSRSGSDYRQQEHLLVCIQAT